MSTKNEGFFVPADFCAHTRLQLNVCCLCILLSEGQFFQANWTEKKHATQSDFVAVHFGWQRVSKNTSVAERSRRLNFTLVHMICCDGTVDFDLAVKSQNPRQDGLFERLLLSRHRTTRALRTSACAAPLVASACCARFLAMVPHTAASAPFFITFELYVPVLWRASISVRDKARGGFGLCRLSAKAARCSSLEKQLRTKWRVQHDVDHAHAARSRLRTLHHPGSRDSLHRVQAQCTHEAVRMVVRATALRILARSAELAVAPKRLSEECQRPAAQIRTMVPSSSKEQCGSTKLAVKGNAELSTLAPDPALSQKNGNRAVPVSCKGRNSNDHLEGLVRLTEALVQWTLTSSRALS